MTSVALYARVSTQEQAERQTVENQLYSLRLHARSRQLTIFGEYIDNGVSGTIPFWQRPAGARLLEDAANKAFSKVVVWRVDRLGRLLKYIIEAHGQLEDLGVGVEIVSHCFLQVGPNLVLTTLVRSPKPGHQP